MKRRSILPAFLLALASILSACFTARLDAQTKFGSTSGAAGSSGGTVTSVAATVPSELTLAGSPITAAGTLAFSWANELTSRIFAAPCGSTGTPTFRVLCSADIPNNAANTTGNAGTATLLAANPTDCTANNFATSIAASGNLGCARPAVADLSDGATLALASDARFTDARTPTAHASTHAAAGSDAVTLTEAQVTNLTTDLAGKAPTGNYIIGTTGDVVATGPGSVSATIQPDSVALGTDTTGGYAASSTEAGPATTAAALAANGSNCSAPNFGRGVDAAGNCEGAAIVASDLPNTAVTPASYTNTSLTVDAQGRITAASSGSAGGVTSLNALTGALTITAGTAGTDFAVSPSGSTITLNLPDASATARGAVTAGTQTYAGAKTFTGSVGLGVTADSNALHVQGTSWLEGSAYIRIGSANGTTAAIPGAVQGVVSSVGNTAATETSIGSETIGTRLLNDGASISVVASGTFAGTVAVDKRIRVRLGSSLSGTLVFDSGNLGITTAASWVLTGRVIRTGAASQKTHWTLVTSDPSVTPKVAYLATSLSFSGMFVIFSGQGTNANDVTCETMHSTYNPL